MQSSDDIRDAKLDIILDLINGKYKCIPAYKIPDNVTLWKRCPNCNLIPLVWEFNNGRHTACGCGKNEYDHFSISAESVVSYFIRNKTLENYDIHELRKNWNNWVDTGVQITNKDLLKDNKW